MVELGTVLSVNRFSTVESKICSKLSLFHCFQFEIINKQKNNTNPKTYGRRILTQRKYAVFIKLFFGHFLARGPNFVIIIDIEWSEENDFCKRLYPYIHCLSVADMILVCISRWRCFLPWNFEFVAIQWRLQKNPHFW